MLTPDQIKFWNANSYLMLPRFFAPHADSLSDWVDEIAGWPHTNHDSWMSFFEMDAPDQLSRVENFIADHPGLAEILNGERILNLMSCLMNEPAVLYKDRINFKLPGGGAHGAHQDGVAYDQGGNASFDPNVPAYLSLLVSIDPATEANGCFQVVPDWPVDRLDILPMEAPYPDNPNYQKIKQDVEDELTWINILTQPGDVIVFTERLPHRSHANRSYRTRRILYGVYNPLQLGDKRVDYFRDKKRQPNDPRYLVGNPHAPVTIEASKYS